MISSIIFFITIFFILCGCVPRQLWQKHKQSTFSKDVHLQLSQQVEHASSIAGPIVPAEQDLQMTENVAYGPLKFTNIK